MAFGDVIRSAASPQVNPQGIGGDASTIWHSATSPDKVYELSVVDFSVVRSADSPAANPRGIGGTVNVIWHVCVISPPTSRVYELSTSDFSVIRYRTFAPTLMGIGGDENAIWLCDLSNVKVQELSIVDLSILRSVTSPATSPMGIGGSASKIWHADDSFAAGEDRVYELSVTDFSVIQWATAPGSAVGDIGGNLTKIWHINPGGTQLIYELDVGIIVPTVTTDPTTLVKGISATLNGTLDDDGGEACDCGFGYGLTDAYGTTTATQSKVTGETFSQAITGLLPDRNYHFRAIATNSAGTSYGSDRTFRTTALGNPNIDQLIFQHSERMERFR